MATEGAGAKTGAEGRGSGNRPAARWRKFLEDPDVKRWYDSRAMNSRATADNFLFVLARFLDSNGLTAKGFLRMNAKARQDLITDYILAMRQRGKAGSTINQLKKALINWLDWNDIKVPQAIRKMRIPGAKDTPTLRGAHKPDQDELRRVFHVADARVKTAIAFMAFAGQRPEVLGDYRGEDGLRLRDLPEAKIVDGELTFTSVPTLVRIPPELGGHPYFTFLGPEGCAVLASYVRERRALGEEVGPGSTVVAPEPGHRNCKCHGNKEFIQSHRLGRMMRAPMRSANVRLRPYAWREYFSSRVQMVEAKGFLRDWKEFMMGHVADISRTYSMAGGELEKDKVEAMRGAYELALPYLETVPQPSRGDVVVEALTLLLEAEGYKQEEIKALGLGERSREGLVRALRDLRPRHLANGGGRATTGGHQRNQRVIQDSELEAYMAEGWAVRMELRDGRLVVQRD